MVTADAVSLRELPDRRDWFAIPHEWVPAIIAVPQVQTFGKIVAVHRTHLPIVQQIFPNAFPIYKNYPTQSAELIDAQLQPYALRPYQHAAREWTAKRRGALLAMGLRTGKTVTSICVHDPSDGPLFVVAPLATRNVWVTWFKRRFPDVEPLILTGRSYDRDKFIGQPIVFANYDILSTWESFGCLKIGTLIFDECHVLSQRGSLRSRAAAVVSTRANRVIGLSGTPLWNKPEGLHTILTCLNPGAWGKYYPYSTRYADGKPGAHGFTTGNATNVEEFKARLSEVMLKISWQDIMEDLPNIDRRVETVELTGDATFQVELAAEAIKKEGQKRIPVGELARYRKLTGDLKVNKVIELTQQIVNSGKRVVVWAWHKDIAKKVLKAFKPNAYIVTGEDSQKKREATLDAWRTADAAVLVITLAVGQAGIDLSQADTCIFAELDFTPAVVAQAEMRTFAPSRGMTVIYTIVDHRVDRALVHALKKKCDVASIIGTPAADAAIDVVGTAFSVEDKADLSRLASAVLADAASDEEGFF